MTQPTRLPVALSFHSWDHRPVSSRILLYRACLLCLLLLSAEGLTQSHSPTSHSGVRSPAGSKDSGEKELSSLQQAQSQALASGDSAKIAETSQAFAKAISARLAKVELRKGDTKAAADFEAQVRSLGGEAYVLQSGASSPVSQHTPVPSAAQQQAASANEERLKKLLAQTYNDLGTAEARQGQYPLAKVHFEEGVRWDTPTPTLLRNLGTVAFRTGDFPTAVRAFAQYLKPTTPTAAVTDPRSQLMYALALFSVGDFPSAAHAFTSVGSDAMQDPRSAYSWAFSLSHTGDPKQANSIAADLTARSLPPDVLSLVCHIFVDTESFQQSVDCYRKIVAADPGFRLAHYQVAESLIRMDRPAEAIPELRQELTISPEDPNVGYSLAFALLQTSSKDEARKLLTTITAEHPEMAQPQYQLGKLLLESGDLPGAIIHLELAEQADGSLDYIHYQLQSAYRKVGRTEDADREARLYREIKARHRDLPAQAH